MKKCAVINDLSGFGKCSLTAAIPVISVMGSEVHPLPTAVLSNQTAYDSFKSLSLTEVMPDFINEWKKLNATFDAILTGFVTDTRQLDIINSFIDEFKTEKTLLIVDPVMADNGKLYDGYSMEMCERIKDLCYRADVITPNISELAYVAEEEPSESLDDLIRYGEKLISKGIKRIAVTGYKEKGNISNIIFENGQVNLVTSKEKGGYFSGTGDIFASVVTGGLLRGMTLYESSTLATEFLEKVIMNTNVDNHNDGIEFEKYLGELI